MLESPVNDVLTLRRAVSLTNKAEKGNERADEMGINGESWVDLSLRPTKFFL